MTTPVLSACQMFAKWADDPQVLELLQYFVRIKTAISHEKQIKKLKKETVTTIMEKNKD